MALVSGDKPGNVVTVPLPPPPSLREIADFKEPKSAPACEHFHVLIKPEPAETTPLIMKGLKEESAKPILRTLRENLQYPWCRNTLARLRLPSTVHDESHYRLWQRRFYPFNVFSESKLQQKLDFMHNNPVTRGLVNSPEDWPWSSWRFYYPEDASILRMDRVG